MPYRPLKQKTIGILGGCSNVATQHYYNFLNSGVNAELGGWEIAETLIAGLNFGNIEAFIRTDDWEGLESYMYDKISALVAAGADLILCVSNTLHKSMESVMAHFDVPMIHIADPTGRAIQDAGLKTVALFGTRPVMQMDYLKDKYRHEFAIETVSPTPEEQDDIDRIIFEQLVKGVFTQASKSRYIDIANRMQADHAVEGVILGCTEIFLILEPSDTPNLPLFNTAKLHCDAAVKFALKP